MIYPLEHLANWSPFRLDALGLVTLIGAQEVNIAVGALQHNRFVENMPLFGSFLIAGDKFTTPLPAYSLFNISDGVYVPVINGWFSRWLASNLQGAGVFLRFELRQNDRKFSYSELIPILIGIVVNASLIALAGLQGDYYGLANAIALTISVLVRRVMVHKKRQCLDRMIGKFEELQVDSQKKKIDEKAVKILITTPEDRNVAISVMQRHFLLYIISDFDTQSSLYGVAKAVGWVAFAVHVVCIGQAFLLSQLCSVGVLASATILTIFGTGNKREAAGRKLVITAHGIDKPENITAATGSEKKSSDNVSCAQVTRQSTKLGILNNPGGKKRSNVLLALKPTKQEEESLIQYRQLPRRAESPESNEWVKKFWEEWTKKRISRNASDMYREMSERFTEP